VEQLRGSASRSGLDVENGLHEFLTTNPELVGLRAAGVELRDLRKPPPT
jgi:uncharacterized NAD-dependent epimerase/dehydratase family protein